MCDLYMLDNRQAKLYTSPLMDNQTSTEFD